MHIGIAGPVDLSLLKRRISGEVKLLPTYSFPLIGQLADALLERGHSLSVFAESTHVAGIRKYEGKGFQIFVCPLRLRRSAYDFYAYERKHLTRAMRESGCDLIHAHWTYEFAAAALDSGVPSLITAHDSPLAILRYFVLTRHFPFWAIKAVLGAMVTRRARQMTTVSPYCKAHIIRLLKPFAPISVVPNGIQRQVLEMGRTRLANGEPPFPLVLATVLQGFQERKNPKSALRAFAKIRRTRPDATLKMFGTDYENGGAADLWSRKHHLNDGVCFMGAIGHEALMRELISSVHILIHPAKEESFGMAPLEAMALGIPVVGGKSSGGVPYVLDNGRAGILVKVTDPDAITSAVLELTSDKTLRTNLARAAWKRAGEEFSLDIMVERYLACYETVLGHGNAES